ncbi:MAG: isoleucine--tRNA ligase [Endomicrobiales bacterium]
MMDYSKTVNLPQTDFPMKANLPQREPVIEKQWNDEKLYHRMQQKNQGKKSFILHDGPPYANGHIHIGTALNKILKDFVVKYACMAGFSSPYTPGWDCHGLPIETQCLKDIKKDKHSVDRVAFRKQAAAFARKFIDIQRSEFKRLGVLADWENPYVTLAPRYEETIVRVFGELVRTGYIYRSKKPVYWCPCCETALADAEVEYADHQSHSVFVKFAVLSASGLPLDGASVLIWTTTPWTLPANVAVAFHPDAQYAYAELSFEGDRTEKLILSKQLLPMVSERLGATSYTVINTFEGKQLNGIVCENPVTKKRSEGITADFVTLDDGTGVVHIAPGHGQEDYQAVRFAYPHLAKDIVSPVDHRGRFTDEVPEFQGQNIFAANALIIDKLKVSGHLLKEQPLNHSYPHCWRCKKPVVFRATPQWFMSVEHNDLKNKLLAAVNGVNWIPSYGHNRMAAMIESRPDWCLSRQRLWGVPVPVFYCQKCGVPLVDHKVIEHIAALFGTMGSDVWFEKTPAELLAPLSVTCSCGGDTFRKEDDILDVWFDSGVSSFAVLESGVFPGLSWPADMYLEGSDQHRGWFQTSLLPSVALRGIAPYKTVLTHGFVVDGEGKKMSKSLGNVIAPEQIISQNGADILRLWVATSDYREDIRISPEILKGQIDSYRKIRNTIRFLLGNIAGFSPAQHTVSFDRLREIDRYALVSLEEVLIEVTTAYQSYEFHKAAIGINSFCTVFLSGFYLDALKDTLYCEALESPIRRSAQTVLWELCTVLTRLLAPILSFTAEEAWQAVRVHDTTLATSVFLADFPTPAGRKISDDMKSLWTTMLQVREKSLAECENLRKDKKIGATLAAHLDIFDDGRLNTVDSDLLAQVLGTWDITKIHTADPGAQARQLDVAAKPSEHAKCERCWRHKDDVTAVAALEGVLCSRCVSVLNGLHQ